MLWLTSCNMWYLQARPCPYSAHLHLRWSLQFSNIVHDCADRGETRKLEFIVRENNAEWKAGTEARDRLVTWQGTTGIQATDLLLVQATSGRDHHVAAPFKQDAALLVLI
mmetsp:Transcript_52075/g.100684  ORF Transcript_52075/g.100684 Transcript_52075/m.100684 type:complete len:110 (-) Transcript_52075:209-538(-)